MSECEACQGYGVRLNPDLIVLRDRPHRGAVSIENPRGLPLFVECEPCGGAGFIRDREKEPTL